MRLHFRFIIFFGIAMLINERIDAHTCDTTRRFILFDAYQTHWHDKCVAFTVYKNKNIKFMRNVRDLVLAEPLGSSYVAWDELIYCILFMR